MKTQNEKLTRRRKGIIASTIVVGMSIAFTCMAIQTGNVAAAGTTSVTYGKHAKTDTDFYGASAANYYVDMLAESNTIVVSNQANYELDTVKHTATLVNYNGLFNLTSDYYKHVRIPETIKVGSDTYTVTKIDTAYDASVYPTAVTETTPLENLSYDKRYVIRALTIPDTVQEITKYSFEGFGSLEYFKTPFVGTSRGSSARGMNSSDNVANNYVSDPIGCMFSNPKYTLGNYGFALDYIGFKDQAAIDAYATSSTITDYNATVIAEYYETEDLIDTKVLYKMPYNLSKIVVSDDDDIGNHALFNLTEVTELEILKNDASKQMVIGQYAFAHSGYVYVYLPRQNVALSTGDFTNCQSLLKVVLPNELTQIPSGLFGNDIALKKVWMPASVTTIQDSAFLGCNNLENVYRYDTADEYNLNPANEPKDVHDTALPVGTIDLTGLRYVGAGAFAGCQHFLDVSLQFTQSSIISEETATRAYIGKGAFNGCYSLKAITLPFVGCYRGGGNSSTNMFGYIFGEDGLDSNSYVVVQNVSGTSDAVTSRIPTSLKTITITNDTTIAENALSNLKEVTSLSISSASSIGAGAFGGMASLNILRVPFMGRTSTSREHIGIVFGTEVYTNSYTAQGYQIPAELEEVYITNQYEIYSYQLYNIKSLKKVDISSQTSIMNGYIFHNNPNLEELVLPFVGYEYGEFYRPYWWWRDKAYRNTLQWIFSETSFENSYFNDSLRYYDGYRKAIPMSLKRVTITNDTVITTYAFRYFYYLEEINILGSRTSYIAESCMVGCQNLKELTIPFVGCDINSKSISGYQYCLGWVFGQGNYGNCYAAGQNATFYIPNNLETVTVQREDAKITNAAFANMKSLIEVHFPNANFTSSVGAYAFYNDTKLRTINIPKAKYATVGDYAFYNVSSILDIREMIPNSVKTIGAYAFAYTSVGGSANATDGESLKLNLANYNKIGNYAFLGCRNIEEIEITPNLNSTTVLGEGVFQNCVSLKNVTLNGFVTKYLFKNCYGITKIDLTGITDIPDGLLSGCYNLDFDTNFGKSNTVPDGLRIDVNTTRIGEGAFQNCSGLSKFLIPSTVRTIESYAFSGCTGLEYMTMPKEVTTIKQRAWADDKGNGNCNPNFYFYVYEAQADWPKGWVENWNCDYPVYILGSTDSNLFTYAYSKTDKAYFITGTEPGVTLSGQIEFPTYHDGLRVVGITNTGTRIENTTEYERKISDQQDITSVIIPAQYYYIAPGTFANGHRVDMYFESTVSTINQWWDSNTMILDGDQKRKGWQVGSFTTCSTDEREWIEKGYIFYGDYWNYVGTGVSKTPTLKASTFELLLEFAPANPTYTGNEITADKILAIFLPARTVLNDAMVDPLFTYKTSDPAYKNRAAITPDMFASWGIDTDYTDLFTYTYENNINAGTARITGVLNGVMYQDYLASLTYANSTLQPANRVNKVYFGGNLKSSFSIARAQVEVFYKTPSITDYSQEELTLYYSMLDYATSFTKEYNNEVWSNSNWANAVTGIDTTKGYQFTGTLATRAKTVGTYLWTANDMYSGYSATHPDAPVNNPDAFRWAERWAIYRNGIDVSRNFDVSIYVKVTITPKKVYLDWTGGNWSTLHPGDYEYGYKGAEIVKPTAAMYYYRDDDDANSYGERLGQELNYTNKAVLAGTKQTITEATYPSDYVVYDAYAYVNPNVAANYTVVNKDGTPNTNATSVGSVIYSPVITVEYRIVKGTVVIKIYDDSYYIPTTADYWTGRIDTVNGSTNGITITGLGKNSVIVGSLKTSSDAPTDYSYRLNTVSEYYFDWTNNTVAVSGHATLGTAAAFHIYRRAVNETDQTVTYIDEHQYGNEFYDVIIDVTSNVKIKYQTFDVDYFICEKDNPSSAVKVATYKDAQTITSESGVRYQIDVTFPVDGKFYQLYAVVNNADQPADMVLKYLYQDPTSMAQLDGPEPLIFQKPNQNIQDFVNITGRHYNTHNQYIQLHTVKSDVQIKTPLTKQYDRHAFDLVKDGFVLKMGTDQASEFTYVFYDLPKIYPNRKVITAPINVGTFYVKITVPEGEYFNAYQNDLECNIIGRKIILDLSGGLSALYIKKDANGNTIESGTYQQFTEANGNTGSKKFDTLYQTFTPDNKYLLAKGYLLGEEYDENGNLVYEADEFVGTLVTGYRNKNGLTTLNEVGQYDYQTGNVTWYQVSWAVYNPAGNTFTSNYDVEVIGSYEITPLQLTVTENHIRKPQMAGSAWDAQADAIEYDGFLHYPGVTVTTESVGSTTYNYTVYYADYDLNGTTSFGGLSKFAPTYVSPTVTKAHPNGTKIYYAVVAPHHETVYGSLDIWIKELTINYEDPAAVIDPDNKDTTGQIIDDEYTYFVDYDGDVHKYIVTVNNPPYATVYYQEVSNTGAVIVDWTDEPFSQKEMNDNTPRFFKWKIEAENYVTVTSDEVYSGHFIKFIVSERNLPDLPLKVDGQTDGFKLIDYEGIYDGQAHTAEVEIPIPYTDPNTSITYNFKLASEATAADTDKDLVYVYYSADYGDLGKDATWTNWIEFTDACKDKEHAYQVWVKVLVPKKFKSHIFQGTVWIKPLQFSGISYNLYNDVFDGKYHTVTLTGTNLQAIPVTEPGYDELMNQIQIPVLDAYGDPTYTYQYFDGSSWIDIDISYTASANVVSAGYGYQSTLKYKDVGNRRVYVKISAPNYEDLILYPPSEDSSNPVKNFPANEIAGDGSDMGNIRISKYTAADFAADVSYEYTEIQYSAAPIDPSELKISTIHDGKRTYTYFAVTKSTSGTFDVDLTQKILGPEELGYYAVYVEFAGTKNCEAAYFTHDNNYTIDGNNPTGGFIIFKIVPRILEVKWTKVIEYDGLDHNPDPYVITGTPDTINLYYEPVAPTTDAYINEVGVYTYKVSMTTVNPNYVLDTDLETEALENIITITVKKRVIIIDIVDSKVYDGKIYDRMNFIGYTTYVDDNGKTKKQELYGLRTANDETATEFISTNLNVTDGIAYSTTLSLPWNLQFSLLQGHMFIARITTNRYVKGTYYYDSTTTEAKINKAIIEWDIIKVTTQIDGNGNTIYVPELDSSNNFISVKEFYDYESGSYPTLEEGGGYIKLEISITNPTMEDLLEDIEDKVVNYDGAAHSINITEQKGFPVALSGAYVEYRAAGTTEAFSLSAPGRINVGSYTYEVKVSKIGYEPYIFTVKLIIKQVSLDITIADLAEAYDGMVDYDVYNGEAKNTTYTINNMKVTIYNFVNDIGKTSKSSLGHMRYYSVDDISKAELEAFYASFDENTTLPYYALEQIIDAGKYYAVVYYAGDPTAWGKSVAIKEIELKPRPLHIDFTPLTTSYTFEKTYDGTPYKIPLTSSTIHEEDLVVGHYFTNTQANLINCSVATNSPNANVSGQFYEGPTDFVWGNMYIYDSTNKNVAKNYKPVLSDNVKVLIKKAYLNANIFYVVDPAYMYSKIYDGLDAYPEYVAPELCTVEFTYYPVDDFTAPLNPEHHQSDVGEYSVVLKVVDSVNYHTSDESFAYMTYPTGYAKITATSAEIVWEDTEVEFDGTAKAPKAYIEYIKSINEQGEPVTEKLYLNVVFIDDDGNESSTKTDSGKYEAYAKWPTALPLVTVPQGTTQHALKKDNYILTNTFEQFTITKRLITIVIGNEDNKYTLSEYTDGHSPLQIPITTNVIGLTTGFSLKSLTGGDIPVLKTASNNVGTYAGSNNFRFDDIIVWYGGNNITSSIIFDVKGTAIILSNKISVDIISIEKPYSIAGYSVMTMDIITYNNLPSSRCAFSFRFSNVSGDEEWHIGDISMKDVGTYEIEYRVNDTLTGTNAYEQGTGSFVIKIVPASSYVAIPTNLDKVYDGTPISVTPSTLIGFNGGAKDLVYTYYEYVTVNGIKTIQNIGTVKTDADGNIVGEAPIDAGEYMVEITSQADTGSGVQNYTTLKVTRDFKITPIKYVLTYVDDREITTSELNDTYISRRKDSVTGQYLVDSSGNYYDTIIVDGQGGIVSGDMGDILTYSIRSKESINSDVDGPQHRNSYTYTNTFMPATVSYVTDSYGNLIPSGFALNQQKNSFAATGAKDDKDYPFRLVWEVRSKYRIDDSGNYADVSRNYYIEFSFDVKIHYKYIKGYTIEDVTSDFTGNPVSATITKAATTDPSDAQVTKTFATSRSNLNDPTKIYTGESQLVSTDLSPTQPGEHVFYYRFTATGYEELEGSFKITINKIDRANIKITSLDLASVIDANVSGITNIGTVKYTGNPVYTKTVTHMTTNTAQDTQYITSPSSQYYVPGINYDLVKVGGKYIADDFVDADVTVSYSKFGSKEKIDPKVGAIDSGTYTFTVTIPESSCYNVTRVSGTFKIEPREIAVLNADETNTNVYSKIYKVDVVGEYQYKLSESTFYKAYLVNDDGSLGAELTYPDFEVEGIMVTKYDSAAHYTGLDATYLWHQSMTPVVYRNGVDQSDNYTVSLKHDERYASMRIEQTQMDFIVTDLSKGYNGSPQIFTVIMNNPKPEEQNVIIEYYLPSTDTWTNDYTSAAYVAAGTYDITFRIVDPSGNYKTVTTNTQFKIGKVVPTGWINSNLNKFYNGQEVSLPEDITIDNTETTSYAYYFKKYDDSTKTWEDYSTIIPSQGVTTGETVTINSQVLHLSRPVFAGKYKVIVEVPETQNYEAKSLEHEFIIDKQDLDITWGNIKSFEYDGKDKAMTIAVKNNNADSIILSEKDIIKDNIIESTFQNAHSAYDTTHKNVGTYIQTISLKPSADAGIQLILDNYQIAAEDKSRQFNIYARSIEIRLTFQTIYVDNPILTNLKGLLSEIPDGPAADPSNVSYGFYVSSQKGICTDVNDQINSQLKFKSISVGRYTDINVGFYWINSRATSGTDQSFILIENNGTDVTGNYNVKTVLDAEINYSNIQFYVTDYDKPYDGNKHMFKVTIMNADADKFVIKYSTTQNGTYTVVPDDQLDEMFGQKDVKLTFNPGPTDDLYDKYYVYFKIYPIDSQNDDSKAQPGSGYIRITPKNAILSFYNPTNPDLSKQYDGKSVANPNVTSDDAAATYTWTYYKATDLNTPLGTTNDINTLVSPTDVGKYILQVDMDGGSSNYTYTPLYLNFNITHAKLTIKVKDTKVYDQYIWAKPIIDNGDTIILDGIITGHYIKRSYGTSLADAYLVTGSAAVGTYNHFVDGNPGDAGKGDIEWQTSNPFDIFDQGGNKVTQNYEVDYDLDVKITTSILAVKVLPYSSDFDGAYHSIKVELIDAVDDNGVVYAKPTYGFTISYAESNDGGATYTAFSNMVSKKNVDYVWVKVQVTCPNYETLIIQNGTPLLNGSESAPNDGKFHSYIEILPLSTDISVTLDTASYEYTGDHYPKPTVTSTSTGTVHYNWYKLGDVIGVDSPFAVGENDGPIDVGSYQLQVIVDGDGIYDSAKATKSFEIVPAKANIEWLPQTKTRNVGGVDQIYIPIEYEELYDSATGEFKAVNLLEKVSAKHALTNYDQIDPTKNINAGDPDLDGCLAVDLKIEINGVKMDLASATLSEVGEYTLYAEPKANTLPYSNYELQNKTIQLVVTPRRVTLPDIKKNLEVIYGDRLVLLDSSDNEFIYTDSSNAGLGFQIGDIQDVIDSGGSSVAALMDATDQKNYVPNLYTITVVYDHAGTATGKITISLKDKTSNVWDVVDDNNNDVVITFDVLTRQIPDADYDVKINYKKIWVYEADENGNGKYIQPLHDDNPKSWSVVLFNKKTGATQELVRDKDFKVNYESNNLVNPNAIIYISGNVNGIENYDFGSSGGSLNKMKLEFEIVSAAPKLIELETTSTARFITADYTRADGFDVNEDLTLERNKDNYKDTGANNFVPFYLSQLDVNTDVQALLDMIKNNDSNIKITSKLGTVLWDGSDSTFVIDTSPTAPKVGTGTLIELFDDNGTLIDSIECVVYGDIDGDGKITTSDVLTVYSFIEGTSNVKLQGETIDAGVEELNMSSLIAMSTDRNQTKITTATTLDLYNVLENGYDLNDKIKTSV